MFVELLVIAGLLFFFAIIALLLGYDKLNQYHLILDTPTSKVRSLALGVVEVKGRPYNPEFMKTPHSHSDCVYYKYKTYEYQIQDPSHPVMTSGWFKISDGTDKTAFYVNDSTGYVLVKPQESVDIVRQKKVLYEPRPGTDAKLTIINRIKRWLYGDFTLLKKTGTGFYEFEPDEYIPFATRVGNRKIYEYYIGPEDDVYVLGTAKHDENAHNMVVIEKGEDEPTFIISNRSEESLLTDSRFSAHSSYKAAVILIILSIMTFLGGFILM